MGRLAVKAIPKASRDVIAGWIGDALKVRVTAAPERGKANLAIIEVIAAVLGVSRERVRVVAGETTARKIVDVNDIAEAELRARVDRYLRESTPVRTLRRGKE